MKIVAEEDNRPGESLRVVVVRYDSEEHGRARIALSLEAYQGAQYSNIVHLTHQEARAIGHALITDAARAQKELEG